MPSTQAYAVFAEYSPATKPMVPGFNVRVFNKTEALSGNEIRLEDGTGIITLAPGTYHMTGFSATVYYTGNEPRESIEIRSPSNAGYCRLRNVDLPTVDGPASNATAICVGSATSANAVPSLVDTYFHSDVQARVVLEHQCGHAVKDVHLQVYVENSVWHVFARLAIRRV